MKLKRIKKVVLLLKVNYSFLDSCRQFCFELMIVNKENKE